MGLAAVYSFSYGQRINTAEISRINFYDPRRPMVTYKINWTLQPQKQLNALHNISIPRKKRIFAVDMIFAFQIYREDCHMKNLCMHLYLGRFYMKMEF